MQYDRRISPEMLAFLSGGEMVESDLYDIVDCCDDINMHQEDSFYFLVGYNHTTVEVFGCPSREGLLPLAVYFNTFVLNTPDILFQGTVQNPLELPYKLDEEESALILFADHSLEVCANITEVTKYIETHLFKYTSSDIDDFVIITGVNLEFDVVEWDNLLRGGIMGNGLL